MDKRRLRVLLIAPYYDRMVPGESWCTYKWVEEICKRSDATVLTSHCEGWNRDDSPTDARKIINWSHPVLTGKFARLGWELKPHYLLFYYRARRWIKSSLRNGFDFDLVHQINPVALRYPSPARNLGLPFVTGPHAGSLETPAGFEAEFSEKQWFRTLRKLDRWRLRHDPFLRSSFASASEVLGVAPYVKDLMRSIPLKHFSIMAETGPDQVLARPRLFSDAGAPLRLLFVGRVIRTKGVIDAIRALALAARHCSATLDIVGTGDMLESCKAEAEKLGISNRVVFHGRLKRERVFDWYRESDVFLFPSFREPSGTVVFEALGFGLPIITSSTGGPGYVITDECGIRVEPTNPEEFASGLADAIVSMAQDRKRLGPMSAAALRRVDEVASWENRGNVLLRIYREATERVPSSC